MTWTPWYGIGQFIIYLGRTYIQFVDKGMHSIWDCLMKLLVVIVFIIGVWIFISFVTRFYYNLIIVSY